MQRGARNLLVAMAAVAAEALTLYAGRHNPSLVLRLIFCVWVLVPFAFALGRAVPGVAALAVAAASLAIYACETLGLLDAKLGFVFLVVPAASLALLVVAALLNRRRASEPRA